MKSIVYIYLILIFFVYIIFCSIVYMLMKDYSENRFNKKVEKLSQTFGKEILNHLNNLKDNISLSDNAVYSVKKKMNNKAYEKVFNDIIISFNKDPQNHVYVKKYMNKFDSYIQRLIKKYSKEGSIKNVYIVFLMGQYKIDNDYINKFLLNSLKTNSLYLRFNALNSISQIGNVKYFVEALSYMSQVGGYLNNKVLIDIMDEFGGDLKKLDDELFKHLEEFSYEIQCIIIDHFKNSNNVFVVQRLADILSYTDTDKEVKASIIKYFNIINYPPVKQVLISLLDSEQWECRALAAKTLSKYYSQDTVDKLLISITDINWYVRLNSAMSLLDFELGDKLINDVLEKNDKYSKEILFYAMFVKHKITYEEFIKETNRQVAVSIC